MKIGNVVVHGVIYKITNNVNNKVYIGQTTRGFDKRYPLAGEGIERIYNYHKGCKKYGKNYNKHILYSIDKYGFASFEVSKIFDIAFSRDELNFKEKLWIKHYKSNVMEYGYNKDEGGADAKLNTETKNRLSEYAKKRIGNLNHFYGKHHSKETLKKVSGANNYRAVGVICLTTNKIFDTISNANKCYGSDVSAIGRACNGTVNYAGILDNKPLRWMYISEYNKLTDKEKEIKRHEKIDCRMKNSKVVCINTEEIFLSSKEAAKRYNINKSCIRKCCNGKAKSAGKDEHGNKLKWKYHDDYLKESINVDSFYFARKEEIYE